MILFSSPLHVVRAGSDARGPGAADAEADRAGVEDAAGVSVTGDRRRGPGARPERAGPGTPRGGTGSGCRRSSLPLAEAEPEYSAGGGDRTPTWEARGALAGRDGGG